MRRLACLLAAVSFLALCPAAKADTISLRGDEWCPYNCAPTDANPGYMIEIAKEIFGKAGHTIDYQLLTWSRTLEKVEAGDFTAAVGAAKDDAPNLVFGKNPLGHSTNTFATRQDDPFVFTGVSSLESRAVGITTGYAYVDEMDAYIEKNKADPKRIQATAGDTAMTTNFNKLLAKRIDLVVDDGNVLSNYIKTHGLEGKAKVIDSTLPASDVYIAFSPKNPKSKEYVALLDKGIEEMRASGRFAEILAKYGMKDWKK